MSDTQSEVAFVPKQPFRIPWSDISIWGSLLVALVLAACAGLVLASIGPGPLASLPQSRGIDLLSAAFLVGAGPASFRYWASRRRLLKLDERLPDFLTDLASLHKAGLTLPDAVITAAGGDYGPLTPEVKMAADQVRWNIPVLTALDNLKARVGTPIAQRTLTVILEAGRTGGNLPEVMDIAARNARTFVQMREMRARQMGLYTIIIYVASLVFIGVALSLQFIFVPKMLERVRRRRCGRPRTRERAPHRRRVPRPLLWRRARTGRRERACGRAHDGRAVPLGAAARVVHRRGDRGRVLTRLTSPFASGKDRSAEGTKSRRTTMP